ncbi:MAG: PDZ domain-containing protein [Chloroflexi bacterium]|nr:PDZ domain-containing protein [Chloroflexota bacterium]
MVDLTCAEPAGRRKALRRGLVRRWRRWSVAAAAAAAAAGLTATHLLTQADPPMLSPRERPVYRVMAVGSAAMTPAPAPYLGLSYLPVPAADPTAAMPGLLITEAAPHSPGDTAGLRSGDLLLAINGVAVERGTPILDLLRSYRAGDTVTLTVSHGGEQWDVSVPLGTSPR